jgi:alpha-D-xyloside xylohydrolase
VATTLTRQADGISLPWQQGTLAIKPLNDNTVRITYSENNSHKRPEWIVTTPTETPTFTVKQNRRQATLTLKDLRVEVNLKTGHLAFFDNRGRLLLSEKPGSRVFKPTTLQGEPCAFVLNTFVSPPDEICLVWGSFRMDIPTCGPSVDALPKSTAR